MEDQSATSLENLETHNSVLILIEFISSFIAVRATMYSASEDVKHAQFIAKVLRLTGIYTHNRQMPSRSTKLSQQSQ